MQVDTEDKWTLFVKLNPGEDKGDSPYQDFAQIEAQLGGCEKQNDYVSTDKTPAKCADTCTLDPVGRLHVRAFAFQVRGVLIGIWGAM